jgi:hypothetical protein
MAWVLVCGGDRGDDVAAAHRFASLGRPAAQQIISRLPPKHPASLLSLSLSLSLSLCRCLFLARSFLPLRRLFPGTHVLTPEAAAVRPLAYRLVHSSFEGPG